MLLLILITSGQRGFASNPRASDPNLNLGGLFPGDDGIIANDDGPDSTAAWRKGKLTLGGDYWWREQGDGEPEISLTDPTDDWRVGVLEEDGREYFWRERGEGDDSDVEVRMARYAGEESPGEAALEDGHEWRVGVLPSGREYLWRETDDPDDPEVQWWTESTLDSGEPFWYDESGEVTLSDPFALARAATEA